jgi:hypothetical protein
MLRRLCLPTKHCIYTWEYGVWLYIDFQLDIWYHSQFQRPTCYMILQETWRDEDEKCFHDIDASTLFVREIYKNRV